MSDWQYEWWVRWPRPGRAAGSLRFTSLGAARRFQKTLLGHTFLQHWRVLREPITCKIIECELDQFVTAHTARRIAEGF